MYQVFSPTVVNPYNNEKSPTTERTSHFTHSIVKTKENTTIFVTPKIQLKECRSHNTG